MKKFIFILVLSIFSAQFVNAQETKFPVLTGKKSETVEKKSSAVSANSISTKQDSTKSKKTKKLSVLKVGSDPQNFLRDIKPGEVLVKYIGHQRIPVKTKSGSGTWSMGFLTPGAGLIVSDEYKKVDKVTTFDIWWCGNNTETLKGASGKALFISTDSLRWIISGDELQKIYQNKYAGFSNEDFLKLSELLERAFGDGGEIEAMGDQLNALNDKVDLLGKDVVSLRASLGLKNNQEKEEKEKIESSSGDWWQWVLGATVVIVGGVLVYKLLQQKDNTGSTIIINPPTGSGGPVNPHN